MSVWATPEVLFDFVYHPAHTALMVRRCTKHSIGCGGLTARSGAGDGNRTHVSSLGSCSSAIELHPRGRRTLVCSTHFGNELRAGRGIAWKYSGTTTRVCGEDLAEETLQRLERDPLRGAVRQQEVIPVCGQCECRVVEYPASAGHNNHGSRGARRSRPPARHPAADLRARARGNSCRRTRGFRVPLRG
jgi:hypothetical protein